MWTNYNRKITEMVIIAYDWYEIITYSYFIC